MLALERKWYPQSIGCSSCSVKRSLKFLDKCDSGEFLFQKIANEIFRSCEFFISYRQFNLYNYFKKLDSIINLI